MDEEEFDYSLLSDEDLEEMANAKRRCTCSNCMACLNMSWSDFF